MSRIQITKTLRRDQPPSPKSFVSPDLTDQRSPASEVPPMPGYVDVTRNWVAESESEDDMSEEFEDEPSNSRITTTSLPRVQLDIPRDSISDWFPPDLFNSDKYTSSQTTDAVTGNGVGTEGNAVGRNGTRAGDGDAASVNGKPSDTMRGAGNGVGNQEGSKANETVDDIPVEEPSQVRYIQSSSSIASTLNILLRSMQPPGNPLHCRFQTAP
jgi:hypothetical protein